jgi:hypothetical protein
MLRFSVSIYDYVALAAAYLLVSVCFMPLPISTMFDAGFSFAFILTTVVVLT